MAGDRVLTALRDVLPESVAVENAPEPGNSRLPGMSTLLLEGRTLKVAWLPVGWPKQVREVLARRKVPDLVAAPELSVGARRILSNAGAGWFDETGAAEILLDRLVVVRDGTPSKPLDTTLGWRPATLAVCEALLTGCEATVTALSNKTQLAMSTVALALRFLETQQLVAARARRGRNAGRTVVDESALLEAYAAAAARLRTPFSVRVGVLWRDPVAGAVELGRSWRAAGLPWSATSALAADAMAPFLTEVSPLEIYVAEQKLSGLRRAASIAGLPEMDGGRLILRPFPTPAASALSTEIRPGLWSAPWPRVFADLRVTGVRGEDAADHLREMLADA